MQLSNEAIFAIEWFLGIFLRVPGWLYAVLAVFTLCTIFYRITLPKRESSSRRESSGSRIISVVTEQKNRKGKRKLRETHIRINDDLFEELKSLLRQENHSEAVLVACRKLKLKRIVAESLMVELDPRT